MNIKIFIVFHKVFDPGILNPFHEKEKSRWFLAYAVNEAHVKHVLIGDTAFELESLRGSASLLPSGLVKEYSLPVYDSTLQELGFMETSSYIHVLENEYLIEDTDYVGVCQYDMRWTHDAVELVRAISNLPSSVKVGCGINVGPIISGDGLFHEKAYADRRNWAFLVESYNQFFSSSVRIEQLIGLPLTLFQTYILPKKEFLDLASWLRKLTTEVYPWACQPPYETHWGSLGGYTERAESLFFAIKLLEKRFLYATLPLDHDPGIAQKLGIQKSHYISG